MKPLVATVAVLVALATGAPVQVQTPELDELRALAEQGDATAQFNLGIMYDNGRGVPQDDAEAVRWYRLAADRGHATARFNLMASRTTDSERGNAVRNFDRVVGRMTPDQLAEAQRLAREWDAAHPPNRRPR